MIECTHFKQNLWC